MRYEGIRFRREFDFTFLSKRVLLAGGLTVKDTDKGFAFFGHAQLTEALAFSSVTLFEASEWCWCVKLGVLCTAAEPDSRPDRHDKKTGKRQ